jgi:hypothetical protein
MTPLRLVEFLLGRNGHATISITRVALRSIRAALLAGFRFRH